MEETASKEDLQEFYMTEKTRIKFELEEMNEQNESKKEGEEKVENNPGFIIRGNELIFIKQDNAKPVAEEAG